MTTPENPFFRSKPAAAPEPPAAPKGNGKSATTATATGAAITPAPTSAPSGLMASSVPRAFADYDLLDEIARGAECIVVKARQVSQNRLVALKLIAPGTPTEAARGSQFRTAAEAARHLHHPNIVPVYEVGEQDGRPFYSMELVAHGSLASDWMRFQGDAAKSARLLAKAAHAVQHAHQRGVLHLDLTPGNILLDAASEPHLVNFRSRPTTGLLPPETRVYAAPELFGKSDPELTTAADVFSLGAILQQLLAGPPPAAAVADSDLAAICARCLARDPNQRYATAEGLAEELERWLRHEPVHAREATAGERVLKWVRRQPALAAVASALIVLAAVALWDSPRAASSSLGERGGAMPSPEIASPPAGAIRPGVAEAEDLAALEASRRAESLARERAEEALRRMAWQQAEEQFAEGRAHLAVAVLARALRDNPSDAAIGERLMAALVQRNFLRPATGVLPHPAHLVAVRFSPDGRHLLTAAEDGVARLWDAQSGGLVRALPAHGGALTIAEFSPNGRLILTASDDGAARIWSAADGQPQGETMRHQRAINFAQFSADNERLLTASQDHSARVWDALTGRPLTGRLSQSNAVTSASFSPDGSFIATAGMRQVRLLDGRTGKWVRNFARHEDTVGLVRFSPDGRWLLSGSGDHSAAIWEVATGKRQGQVLQHGGRVTEGEFSPDGQRVVTGAADGLARIWDATTGKPLSPALRHDGPVNAARFSADGLSLVTAAQDGTARLWGGHTGAPLAEPVRRGAPIADATFSPDGQRLALATRDLRPGIWHALPGGALASPLKHPGRINDLAFSRDGAQLASASRDGTTRLWDAHSRQLLLTLKHAGPVHSVRFSPDGRWVLTASHDATARLWDANTGRTPSEPLRHPAAVLSARFSVDGLRVLTVGADHAARVWDPRTGQSLGERLQHAAPVRAAHFSPDGTRVLTASEDGTARLWEAATGRAIGNPFTHRSPVTDAQFSPDGTRLITVSWSRKQIWDAHSGSPLAALKLTGSVAGVEFTPDGLRVALRHGENAVSLFHTLTGEPAVASLAHPARVTSLQFSADGSALATGSRDKSVRWWDTRTGLPLTDAFPLSGEVHALELSPNGRWLAAAGMGGGVWLIESPLARGPPPAWLPELAETLAGLRLNEHRRVEFDSRDPLRELERLQRQTSLRSETSDWAVRGRWLAADRSGRTIAPYATETTPQFVQDRVRENQPAAWLQALRLSPTNAVALARLARSLAQQDPATNRLAAVEAEFLSRRAGELAPGNSEVRKLRAETATRLKSVAKQ